MSSTLDVHISHAGKSPLDGVEGPLKVSEGTLGEIIEEIDDTHEGFAHLILDGESASIGSNAAVYSSVVVTPQEKIYESEATESISSLSTKVTSSEGPLLIALFNPEHILNVLQDTLGETDERFHDAETSTRGRSYRTFIDKLPGGDEAIRKTQEPLFPFVQGKQIDALLADGQIDPKTNAFVPSPLKEAISKLWEIEEDLSLRLFQEDALRHILGELHGNSPPNPLLLSIPTGGGKTEAFLIPLVAHLFDKKRRMIQDGRRPHPAVRSVVMYPTRALANDQARRIAEVLYWLNQGQPAENKVSVGVLTGDTDYKAYGSFGVKSSLLQTCPRCGEALSEFEIPSRDDEFVVARCSCGAEIDYFRFTRQDILNHQPDILITSPDMVNRMLQSPRYHEHIFSPDIDVTVFDEIHVYESVFGCNVAHLLRRFEEACGERPMYTGVSATINNAKQLACLIFDSSLNDTTYLRPRRQDEDETEEKRSYLDYDAGKTRRRLHATLAAPNKNVTSTLNVVDALGHLIRDPHFRKTLIFANYRNDTDDLIRYMRDQEDRYYETYRTELYGRIKTALEQDGTLEKLEFSESDRAIVKSVDRWFRYAKESGALYTPKLEIGWHRGGLERKQRIKAVNRFSTTRKLSDEDPIDVMVATRTLELGIDIGDVTTVVNNGSPATTNEYAQRVGRGGRKRDGMALTVVDSSNPNDLYFLRHFEEFARPDSDDFEDAPIIISNPEVLYSHIRARLLDHLARNLSDDSREVTAEDLKKHQVFQGGGSAVFEHEPEDFAHRMFEKIFPQDKVARLTRWIRREAELIPNIEPTDIDRAQLKDRWRSLLLDLHDKMTGQRSEIEDHDKLSGMGSVYGDLVPNLRSSGASVGLHLVREGSDDEEKDSVPLSQAIRSHPPGGHASQGSMSYEIYSIKEEDHDQSKSIRKLFAQDDPDIDELTSYYSRMFGKADESSPFPKDSSDVLVDVDGFVVPEELGVKYYPYRFYCPDCGATYSHKKAGDDRCKICYSELRQLTEIYMCGGCGRIFDPPVPKVCLNPECLRTATSDQDGTRFMDGGFKEVGKGDKHNEYFRFTALPNLHWKCRKCDSELNFHQHYNLPEIVRNQVFNADFAEENHSPAEMAKEFLYYPESYYFGPSRYRKEGFNKTRFKCPDCDDRGTYKKIHAKNIPSIRTEIHDYVLQRQRYAEDQDLSVGSNDVGEARYPRSTILSLGREYYQRFYSYSENTTEVNHGEVFPDDNRYLAHRYDTHSVHLDFSDTLDPFLEEVDRVDQCASGSCACSPYELNGTSSETDERTGPQPRLLDWERNRKPDPRRKWCDVIQGKVDGKECPDKKGLEGCAECPFFDRREYVRYLALHTLKHALILAMPRYTGVNRFDIQGKIYPNDKREDDLVLIDQVEGGSGSLYLFRKNWEQIWDAAGDLLEVAVEDDGRLVLAHGCSRYNCDLCPHLALDYHRYAGQQIEVEA